MATLKEAVGKSGKNNPDDVRIVQGLLVRHADWLSAASPPAPSGNCDQATIAAITAFQRDPGALLTQDGRVDPNGFTLRWLSRDKIPKRQHPVFVEGRVAHAPAAPSDDDYAAAAKKLGSDVASIKAVAEVETGIRGSWDPDGRPVILFERHKFASKTSGQFTSSHPDISNPTPGGYGLYSAQHPKLKRAAALDEQAALKSASWGGYQIMGENYMSAGFATVDAFVSAQMESEGRQLDAFVNVVLANNNWLKAFQDQDWSTFASGYNGPGYKRNERHENEGGVRASRATASPARSLTMHQALSSLAATVMAVTGACCLAAAAHAPELLPAAGAPTPSGPAVVVRVGPGVDGAIRVSSVTFLSRPGTNAGEGSKSMCGLIIEGHGRPPQGVITVGTGVTEATPSCDAVLAVGAVPAAAGEKLSRLGAIQVVSSRNAENGRAAVVVRRGRDGTWLVDDEATARVDTITRYTIAEMRRHLR